MRVSHTHAHTHSRWGGWGGLRPSAPTPLSLLPPQDPAPPGLLSWGQPWTGAPTPQGEEAGRPPWGPRMGGRAPRGQGFRRAVLKDPGVSAVPEGLGQVGQVALGGSFHCWAGLDGFWGLFLSQELRGVTPCIRSAGGLEGPAPAPCVRDGFEPACSSAPQFR